MGLWNGDMVLENILLKEAVINGWPLRVIGGHLGRLKISVPWNKLNKQPAVLTVDELLVVLGPRGKS